MNTIASVPATSRRSFFALAGATALASGTLGACANGALSSGATAFLDTVVSAINSVVNGISGVLSQLANITGVTLPANLIGEITGWLNLLSQLIQQIVAAGATATTGTLVQKVENYINLILGAAPGLLASLANIPVVGTFATILETAFAAASVVVPFLEAAIAYFTGATTTTPTPASVTPTSTPSSHKFRVRFGGSFTNAQQGITFLNSESVTP
jgi:hypothetical protein